ncbi:RING-H2 finger protein ATL3 [Raphanus sativus]|uniref:RING-type E3 ubiquitin transferase n=1 Tax=Raphanus sativus TaxID=3726 RepID=A0A6J0LB56_RAPSA|nr:RING-H2 finger protein ATL3 [Raphanus sativus]KAJ4874944.1 RING-H2 finger protein ATL3 [Raphanus sativus]
MDGDGSAHSSLFGDLTTEEVTSKIILTAVIVLFMAVLFVLILHLYAKLYWWRIDHLQQQLQQQEQEEDEPSSIAPPVVLTRRQRRRFIFAPGQQDALPNTGGLTPFELSSLPVVFFRQDTCKEGLECAICLSELVKGDKARLLPECKHSFHVECIDMWFQSHSTCPICRNAVLGTDQASSKGIIEQVPENVSSSDALSQISTSSSDFPTNVLVWGRQDQVSTRNTNVGSQQEEGNGNNAASQSHDALVLDINDSATRSQNVPSSSSSSMRFIAEEEEPKSPMTTRLRSLRRFLSRDKRVSCSNSNSNAAAASSSSVDP